ncbi:DUF726 domain-containing protein [Thalassovita sp.]|uniref:DUF726 domain-containing protein n=1 Tax=Thalassovita sp. TaxID=1979401 RepID=UPI002B273D17|nr:DUF726 domain-containing protein [Thalassovita sp.]
MPILRINATDTGPHLHGSGYRLQPVLQDLAQGAGPVILMVHGFKFAPGADDDCPHRHILSLTPAVACWKAQSWPAGLGFGRGAHDEGLGIAFGWQGCGTIWQAYRRAAQAGEALAEVIATLRRHAPDQPIHAIAHSMGARVVLSALPRLPANSLNRMLLLGGAEYHSTALAAMTTPAGRSAELINVTSRENDLYDFLLERLVARPERGDTTLGARAPGTRNTLTLQLDDPATLLAFARRGIRVAPPERRVCHWSFYLREGAFGLYSALLRDAHSFPLDTLQAMLPETPSPRWSRLFSLPDIPLPLPLAGKAPL